jgi:glyoxylase-like metal-dependent hydrolase (beta-lactamase superfamily II)
MQVYSIDTGLFKLDGGAMFGVVPKTLWQKSIPADENNRCTFAMRCLLVVDGERKILIDTGMGNKQSEKFFSHYFPHGNDSLLGSLLRLGFQPTDITDVLLTHLSRINDKLELTFPNAYYWSSEAHWQWATQPNAREKASFLSENILPILEKGRLRFVEEKKGEKTTFSSNIDIMFTNGHTRSMMHPLINIHGRTLAYVADLIPTAAHIPLPYIAGYDMYPMTSLEEKEIYLEEAVANNHVLFLEHDPTTICCTVEKTEKGFRKKEIIQLETLI